MLESKKYKTKKTKIFYVFLAMSMSFFWSCSEDDKCDSECLHGGICISGSCDCTDGYTGDNCVLQITPSAIQITKIEILEWPVVDANGMPWDVSSNPDLILEVEYDSDILWRNSTYILDADPNVMHEIKPTPKLVLKKELLTYYTIYLYDHDDLDEDDFMGGLLFVPYNLTNDFPSTMILDAGGNVVFKIHLSYTW